MGERARIGLVMTGGTIAGTMDRSRPDGMLVIDLAHSTMDNDAQLAAHAWPGPETLDLRTRTPIYKLSENMHPHDWVVIAESIRNLVSTDNVRSVVVLHGTDTMGMSSAALSFLLADVDATVVLTGSNVVASELNSDALTNVAGALTASRSLPSGVYLSFAGKAGAPSYVFVGTTVRKAMAEGQGYEAPNHGPLAIIRRNNLEPLNDAPARDTTIRAAQAMSDEVASLHVHPGIDLNAYFDMLTRSARRGVVVHLYPGATAAESGLGSLPTFTAKCVEAGVSVITCVDRFADSPARYASFAASATEGAVFARDMIPETAFVKLSWALAQSSDRSEVERLFLHPVAGETAVTFPIAS